MASPAPEPVPLERLEAQICELAGHLAAATCRFLVRLGDFDARRGWASWELTSCAAWLSWKCQLSPGTAREQVRVARALRALPVIRAEFAAGRLSYAKVRALTRIAAPGTEAGLAELAGPMTGSQLERFARAHRRVGRAGDAAARVRRRLAWRIEEDGSLAGTFRLPPLQGAVLLQALRAAVGDLEHPHGGPGEEQPGVSAETPAAGRAAAGQEPAGDGPGAGKPVVATSSSLADGLAAIAEAFLAGKVAGADDPEVYQLVVHVGADALNPPAAAAAVEASPAEASAAGDGAAGDGAAGDGGLAAPGSADTAGAAASADAGAWADAGTSADTVSAGAGAGEPGGVSAETPGAAAAGLAAAAAARVPGDPGDPARCHVEDGPAISGTTAQMIGCAAALSWMVHDRDGSVLQLGRRRRRPSAALRRAARNRDRCRCRFPGCESRRIDLHHIRYWSHGGRTDLANMISLCRRHHRLVHDRGYLIAAARDGTFGFWRPDGTRIPSCPPLPAAAGSIEDCHDADITPGTIIPPWYGERLDLDHAIYVCFANARTPEERQGQRDQIAAQQPPCSHGWGADPFDWSPRLQPARR